MTMHAVVAGWMLADSGYSGANRRLLGLLESAHASLGRDERVTVLHHPSFAPPELARIGWRAVDIARGPAWQRARAERRLLPSALDDLGATVYDHGFLPAPRVAVPLCLTVHDVRDADGHGRWPRLLARAVLVRALRRAAAVVTVSDWTAARLRALAPGCAPRVVPNGVRIEPGGRDLQDVPEHGFVLHVGHLEPRKNLAVLLRALAALDDGRRPELWLVGQDAGAWPKLRALAERLGIAGSVRHLGVQPDSALPAFYRAARLVAVPSLYEGFGLPALEARAHGARVAVSDRGALREVVGDGDVLPADDAAAWAAAMDAPREDRADVVARRVAAASACSWAAASRQWLEVLRAVSAARS